MQEPTISCGGNVLLYRRADLVYQVGHYRRQHPILELLLHDGDMVRIVVHLLADRVPVLQELFETAEDQRLRGRSPHNG